MLSTQLIHYIFKGHKIAIRRVIFEYWKVSFHINNNMTLNGYQASVIDLNLLFFQQRYKRNFSIVQQNLD